MLPSLSSVGFSYRAVTAIAEVLTKPEVTGALEALLKAGQELARWQSRIEAFAEEIEELGFPRAYQATASAPFDAISDFLRGMHGAMLDMYRQPDKLLQACDKLLPVTLERAVATAKSSGNPRVFIALHRGSDGFMSLKQFETLYWPGLKSVVLGLVDEGLIPCIFFEGDYTSRLEYLLELPRGNILGHFDSTDIFRAKVVDVAPESVIVEITGTEDKIESLVELLRPIGILEMVRTGQVAMMRGSGVGIRYIPGTNGHKKEEMLA